MSAALGKESSSNKPHVSRERSGNKKGANLAKLQGGGYRQKGRGISQDDLEREFPSLSVLTSGSPKAANQAWVAVFDARPDAMHALLADFVKQVYAQPGRIGQRPMPREEQVDLESLFYGEENEDPLPVVLKRLIKVSARMFSVQSGISRSQVQRILDGTYDPTVHEIRMIAKAVKRPPLYFVEYRKAMAIAAFINLIEERPGIAMSLYKNYLEVRM